MKYRLLNNEELKELEKEFINFLIVNSVTAEDWIKMKSDAPQHAAGMIELFSDMVLENVLQKIKYLEHRSADNLMLFCCHEDKMILVCLMVAVPGVDLNDHVSLNNLINSADGNVKIFKQEKKYTKTRALEIFEMTEQGCCVTDDKLLNILAEMS